MESPLPQSSLHQHLDTIFQSGLLQVGQKMSIKNMNCLGMNGPPHLINQVSNCYFESQLQTHQQSVSREKKGCSCKNSRCLKLYCECFARGDYCGPHCHCSCCGNNQENESKRAETISRILEKNPDAFRAKITVNPNNSQQYQKNNNLLNKPMSQCDL